MTNDEFKDSFFSSKGDLMHPEYDIRCNLCLEPIHLKKRYGKKITAVVKHVNNGKSYTLEGFNVCKRVWAEVNIGFNNRHKHVYSSRWSDEMLALFAGNKTDKNG